MPRGIGRPGGRKTKLNPLTHGGNRLEVRQAKTPVRTQMAAERKAFKAAKSMNTAGKLKAMRVNSQ